MEANAEPGAEWLPTRQGLGGGGAPYQAGVLRLLESPCSSVPPSVLLFPNRLRDGNSEQSVVAGIEGEARRRLSCTHPGGEECWTDSNASGFPSGLEGGMPSSGIPTGKGVNKIQKAMTPQVRGINGQRGALSLFLEEVVGRKNSKNIQWTRSLLQR